MKGWWCFLGIIPVLETLTIYVNESKECPDVCFCWDLITNCQNKGLSQLPKGIDPKVISLDVSINKITNIPDRLKTYVNLKYLNISHNRLAALSHLDFDGLSKLELLDLSFNYYHDWKDFQPQTFWNLPNLTFIEFSSNPLSNLPQFSTHFKIKSLQVLKLNNCSISALPNGFLSGMTNIKEIHLNSNPIEILNLPLNSETLKFMDLSKTSLFYLAPNSFKELKGLETVQLNKNKYLRNVTINSDSLLFLDISESFLEVPPYGDMKYLTALNLHGNILRELTNNMFINMSSLTFLNISLNAITLIEANAFRGLEELKTLDLSFNKINIVGEKTFLSTKSLLSLDLSHNYLTSLDSITSMSLNVLDVSYCEIKSVGKYTLSTLPKLTYLSLKRNFISYIPDEWVGDKLKILDLSDCRIKSINNLTFRDMQDLQDLDFSNNRLITVQFSNFPLGLTTVKLRDNQWRCDCAVLKDTFDWLQIHGSFVDDLICDSPESVDGMTWQSACEEQWYPSSNKKDHLWWYSIALLISMIFLLFTVVALRKLNDIREKRFREIEERRRQQEREAREALQRMQQMQREYREEANRNAPDPRESQGPPSYNDALLLPRLDSSHPSLAGSLHSLGGSIHGSNPEVNKKGKVRRKKRRRRSESTDRIQTRSIAENSNESEPERSNRPMESDF